MVHLSLFATAFMGAFIGTFFLSALKSASSRVKKQNNIEDGDLFL